VSTNWLLTLGVKQRKQVLVGNSALCWPIWMSYFLQITYENIYAGTIESNTLVVQSMSATLTS
jgi:hypothetical protein